MKSISTKNINCACLRQRLALLVLLALAVEMMTCRVTSRKLKLVVWRVVIVVIMVALIRLYTDNPFSASISVRDINDKRLQNPKLSPYNITTHAITHSENKSGTYSKSYTATKNVEKVLPILPNTDSKEKNQSVSFTFNYSLMNVGLDNFSIWL